MSTEEDYKAHDSHKLRTSSRIVLVLIGLAMLFVLTSRGANAFLYYAASAIPSTIVFTSAMALFSFGIHRFNANDVLSLKHCAMMFVGFWTFASLIGVVGGEGSASIPARISVVVLFTATVFFGVALIFGKHRTTTSSSQEYHTDSHGTKAS